jgi:prolyl oligopeptidase
MKSLAAVLTLALCALFTRAEKPAYPPAKTEKVADTLHGVAVPDPYRWLEDGESRAVKEWTAKQNALTRSVLDKVPGREKVRARLDEYLDVGTIAGGVPRRGRVFFTKREGKQNQAVLYVREGEKASVVVDPNPLAKDGTVTLDWWFPSRDGKHVAYGLSSAGSEQSTLRVRDVSTGKDLPDTIERTRAASVAWTPDGKGFYYTRYPKPGGVPKGEENYNRHVFYHELGTDPAEDAEVFGRGRPAQDWPLVALSPDGRWLVVTVEKGWAKNEVFVKDRLKNEDFFPLVEGVDAIFKVVPRDDRLYVLTNDKAPRFKLMSVEPHKWDRKYWKEVIPEGADVIEAVLPNGPYLAVLSSRSATSRIDLFIDGKWRNSLGVRGTITGLRGEADGEELFYNYQSFTDAPGLYRWNMRAEGAAVKQPEVWEKVKSGIDPDRYRVEQVNYQSKDGTPISMFIIEKRPPVKVVGKQPLPPRTGKTPTVLYGYGGFNIALTPTFNPARYLPIVDRGGIMAVANLRGGSEYGEEWHRAGMLDKKQNVIDDFIAAAEFLIKDGYTDKEHLAIMGRSNGGLLVGAALTQRPDLFRAAVCGVPLLDMVRYHKFLIAKLWVPEYGSADDPDQFKWLHAYSPYHRVKDGVAYPAVLLTTAESDTRVDPLHARKMAARLQAATSSDRPILLRLEEKAGHGQGKPRGKLLDEETDVWTFLFAQLGVAP